MLSFKLILVLCALWIGDSFAWASKGLSMTRITGMTSLHSSEELAKEDQIMKEWGEYADKMSAVCKKLYPGHPKVEGKQVDPGYEGLQDSALDIINQKMERDGNFNQESTIKKDELGDEPQSNKIKIQELERKIAYLSKEEEKEGEEKQEATGEWEEHIHHKSGARYWFNPFTGESTWKDPSTGVYPVNK